MRISLGVLREYLQATQEQHDVILIEGRVEDAREKYPDLTDEDFDFLVANQPAGSNNKYLLWACARADELLENDPDRTALQIVVQAIRLFDGNKQRLEKKDLYQYKTTSEVEEAVEKLGGSSKNQQAKQARADTDVIYNDERFMVLRPHTTEASCKYGVGTRWCIAATASRNYFNQYSQSNNKFYFIIDKAAQASDPNSKLAVVIQDPVNDESQKRIQVFNAPDRQVGLQTAINHCGEKWPAIWTKIKEHVAKNADTREVEDARKATEEHVKSLLKGERVSNDGLKKIAKDAKLSTPVVNALIKAMTDYTGPRDYTDPRSDIISSLSNRAAQLTPEAALKLIKYIPTTKPEGERYWSGEYHLKELIRNAPLTPEAFRELVASANDEVLIQLVSNPNIPSDVIQSLAGRMGEIQNRELKRQVWRSLIRSGEITAEQMRTALSEDDGTWYGGIRYDILHNPELSSRLSPDLLRMVPVKNGEELKKFLALPNVPPDLAADLISKYWAQLKKHELYDLLKTVKLPTEMIERIWANKDQHIRISLLQNPAIGAENLAKFARSRNSAYRFAVAHNPETSAEDLQILAGDESASTRAGVASNPKTPAETLKVLGGDEATVVRASVASNAKTPQNVLNALRRDSDNFVRKSAAKTLKSLTRTESLIREMLSMRNLLTEELADDDAEDIMNPSWREIAADRDITVAEFISLYLLQNNGSATREELEDAYQNWKGRAGAKELWQTNKHSDEIFRGATAGGRGWYWAPPGINKGALFRLTPAGASAAMALLGKNRQSPGHRPSAQVTAATATPGKTYYLPTATQATDITRYANAELGVEEIAVDNNGVPIRRNGEHVKLNPNRSRRDQRRQKAAKALQINGTSYVLMSALPKVNLPENTAVEFVKSFHGFRGRSSNYYGYGYGADSTSAIVKHGDRVYIVSFPLWVQQGGARPETREPNVAPPVKKSPPPRELNPNAAAAAPRVAAPAAGGAAAAAPRGPKTTYKIYGRFKGRPVATRLKGQAYVPPVDITTQFSPGEQAIISPGEDGKLNVKKADGDHTQSWEPIDG